MFKDFLKVLKTRETRKRILFTVLIFIIYRYGCILPIPGINREYFNIQADSIFAVMNLMGGGALSRFSIFALGISPYITASIIVQLLAMDVVPFLSEWNKEGEKGRRKMEKATRYLSVLLSLFQGFSITYGFDRQYGILAGDGVFAYLFVMLLQLAGTMLIVWLADQITLKGVGNGVSMIIFAGIVSELPSTLYDTFVYLNYGNEGGPVPFSHLKFILYIVTFMLLIAFVIMVECAERRIPVQNANGSNIYGTNMSFMPVKINPAGVIPVIFAQTILTAPQIIASFFSYDAYKAMSDVMSLSKPFGLAVYACLSFFMTFFYTSMVMDPEDIAENLHKSDSFVPAVRPGKDTVSFLSKVIYRTTFVGAVGLTLLALLPYLLSMFTSLPTVSALGGTGIIVVVGVTLETMRELEAKVIENKYDAGWF